VTVGVGVDVQVDVRVDVGVTVGVRDPLALGVAVLEGVRDAVSE